MSSGPPVIIVRHWKHGKTYWSASRHQWVAHPGLATRYASSLDCPKHVLFGNGDPRKLNRILNRYWLGDMCWATVEYAPCNPAYDPEP